jgi:hypothetical protein
MFGVDASANATRTDVSSAVSEITAGGSGLSAFVQATAGFRPVAAARSSQFDGTDDYLSQGNDRGTLTLSTSTTVPDGASSSGSHGACCTGLGRFSDGQFVIGNHGRDGGSDPTPIPSIMCFALGSTTPVWETTCASIGVASSASVQGVVVLPDDTVWACAAGTGDMIHLARDGSLIEVKSGFSSVANGITYDPAYPGHLVVGLSNSAVVSWIRLSDMATVKTVTLTSTPDQLAFDAVRGCLWFTYGTDGVSGNVSAFSLKNNALIGNYVSTSADCIEGLVWAGSTVYIANDAYFHSGASGLNQILTFTATALPTGAAPGSAFSLGWAGMIPSTKASTGVVLCGGQPSLTTAGTTGVGLYIPTSSSTVLRLIIQNQTYNFTVDLLTWHAYRFKFDLTAETVELFIDGASQGVTSISTISIAYLTSQNWALGAEHRSTGPVTFGKSYVGRAIGYIDAAFDSEVDAWLMAA